MHGGHDRRNQGHLRKAKGQSKKDRGHSSSAGSQLRRDYSQPRRDEDQIRGHKNRTECHLGEDGGRSELEETIKHRVGDILALVDQLTQVSARNSVRRLSKRSQAYKQL
jgi:hypothetical protein